MRKLEISSKVSKSLEKMPQKYKQLIESRIFSLPINPVPSDAKFLKRVKQGLIFKVRVDILESFTS